MARRPKDAVASTLRVTRAGYEPVTAFDQEIHARYPVGSTVEADIHQRKSNPQLRLYFSFLAFVVEATGRFGNARALSNALLIEGGYVDQIQLWGGGVHVQPQSIAEMDHQEFSRFCELAFGVVYEEFGLSVDEFKRHMASTYRTAR